MKKKILSIKRKIGEKASHCKKGTSIINPKKIQPAINFITQQWYNIETFKTAVISYMDHAYKNLHQRPEL